MSTVVRALHSSERLRAEQGKAELKADFVQLRAKGLPYLRIAERLGVAKSTLANWNTELEHFHPDRNLVSIPTPLWT
jgi:DNA invertase Pin-like site-specific DNA recombinase